MSQQSLPEDFISAMIELRKLDGLTENDQPMRHDIRMLKREAENILAEACQRAGRLARAARSIVDSANEAIKEATEEAEKQKLEGGA